MPLYINELWRVKLIMYNIFSVSIIIINELEKIRI